MKTIVSYDADFGNGTKIRNSNEFNTLEQVATYINITTYAGYPVISNIEYQEV